MYPVSCPQQAKQAGGPGALQHLLKVAEKIEKAKSKRLKVKPYV